MKPIQVAVVCSLLAFGTGCRVVPGKHAATPQRPTVSSDTNTTAEGSVELETGLAVDPGDSFSTPSALKYGIGPISEVFLGFSPYNRVERPGNDGEGFGDVVIGGRHRFWEDGRGTSAAVQLATKLPTSDRDEGLGSGEVDFAAAAIATHAIDAVTSVTLYYELGALGDANGAGTDAQHTLAVSGGHALDERLGVFAELAHIASPGGTDPSFATAGATYALSPGLILDCGVSLGLNDDAADAVLLAGLTMNLGP